MYNVNYHVLSNLDVNNFYKTRFSYYCKIDSYCNIELNISNVLSSFGYGKGIEYDHICVVKFYHNVILVDVFVYPKNVHSKTEI